VPADAAHEALALTTPDRRALRLRAARQQRLLVSLRQQLDIGQVQAHQPARGAIGQSVRTDISRGRSQLLGLAERRHALDRSITFPRPTIRKAARRAAIVTPRVSQSALPSRTRSTSIRASPRARDALSRSAEL
jgi:hypothetical protein